MAPEVFQTRELVGIAIYLICLPSLVFCVRRRYFARVTAILLVIVLWTLIFTHHCYRPEKIDYPHCCGCFWAMVEGAVGALLAVISLIFSLVFLLLRRYKQAFWALGICIAIFVARAIVAYLFGGEFSNL